LKRSPGSILTQFPEPSAMNWWEIVIMSRSITLAPSMTVGPPPTKMGRAIGMH
jgi:hypothetical protein